MRFNPSVGYADSSPARGAIGAINRNLNFYCVSLISIPCPERFCKMFDNFTLLGYNILATGSDSRAPRPKGRV